MKKPLALFLGFALIAALMTGCGGNSDPANDGNAGDGTASDNMVVEPQNGSTQAPDTEDAEDPSGDAGSAESTAEPASDEDVTAAMETILAVNEVPNARAFDDFSVEYDLGLTMENIESYAGYLTNDAPSDSALVFVAKVKEGTVDTVLAQLEAAKKSMSSSLYAEYADATAKASDARIVSSGNLVAFVIAGVNGPDYSAIDEAIQQAMPK